MPRLNLTVIRSADIDLAHDFYCLFGLNFERHSHGKGPEHYATVDLDSVFEIYPATTKFPPSISTRIGFEVDSCDEVVSLLEDEGFAIASDPTDSPWGRRAVVIDPDGHKVEVVSKI